MHTPSIAFRYLPPRKDVVNQCLELCPSDKTKLEMRGHAPCSTWVNTNIWHFHFDDAVAAKYRRPGKILKHRSKSVERRSRLCYSILLQLDSVAADVSTRMSS